MKERFSFSREYTDIIKGIAILLMLFHHLFGFPMWYAEGISYIGVPLRVNTLEYVLGQFGHICVSLFAFVSGYGLFFSYKSGNILKKSVKRLFSFLLGYWLILFCVAIPIHLALGKTGITPVLILRNMFAHDCTLVPFAWYVRFYIAVVITLPIFYRLMSKHAFITIPLFLLLPLAINYCLSFVPGINGTVITIVYRTMEYFLWLPCVLMGLCFAKYGLFIKLSSLFEKLKKAELPVILLLMTILLYLRAYKPDTIGVIFSFDCFYAPAFVFLAGGIISVFPKIIKNLLTLLGRHSMNIWFLHSMFFFQTAELMKFAYAPKISLLIVGWVILLCLPVSKLMNALSELLLHKRQHKPQQLKQ